VVALKCKHGDWFNQQALNHIN